MRPLRVVPVLAAVALLATACSSSSGSEPSPAQTTAPGGGASAPVDGTDDIDQGAVPSAALTRALPPLSSLKVSFSRRTSSLSSPTYVTSARDGVGRLFVTERAGLVRVYLGNGKVQSKPYLDIRSRVSNDGGERGLLGLAFRSDFAKRPYLWVYYVNNTGSLQVSRFTASSAKATSVSAATERKVLTIAHPGAANHNGGMLAFGRDGLLYIGTGDGGGGGDPFDNAQDRSSLLGKILRIDAIHFCGKLSYCIPRTNPYATSTTARRQIWAVGVRNPWRFSVDPANGDLWIGDVGQDAYEEIDRIPYGKGGWNLGWPCREATHVYDSGRCRTGVTYRSPVASYSHALGESVTGGYVYRGSRYASLVAGRYVYGDFVSGRIWLRSVGGTSRVVGSLPGVSSFGLGDTGELWAVTLDGGLYAMKVAKV